VRRLDDEVGDCPTLQNPSGRLMTPDEMLRFEEQVLHERETDDTIPARDLMRCWRSLNTRWRLRHTRVSATGFGND
jgi:hypothetical protein